MNKEVKERWVSALRSGNYKQTRGMLRNEEGFCCIGVLADLIEPKAWEKSDSAEGYYLFFYERTDGIRDYTTARLPWGIREIVGLPMGAQSLLVAKNDTEKEDFNKIADWIEENL